MTSTQPIVLAAAEAGGSVEACDVCAHPDATHDAIARRFCKATMTNALSRNCICPPPRAR